MVLFDVTSLHNEHLRIPDTLHLIKDFVDKDNEFAWEMSAVGCDSDVV